MPERAKNGLIVAALLALLAGGAAMSQGTRPAAGEASPGPAAAKAPPPDQGQTTAKASAAAAAGCVPLVTANGYGPWAGYAMESARRNWETIAGNNYGDNYSLWNNAANKGDSCSRSGGLVGKWTCTLTAEPCLAGGTSTNTSGPACHGSLSVTGGQALVQHPFAENNARNQWQNAAAQAYGDEYKAWNTAQDKSLFCSHNGVFGPGRRWHCTATGKPCR